MLGRVRQFKFRQIGPLLRRTTNSGSNSANVGQHRTILGQLRPHLDEFGQFRGDFRQRLACRADSREISTDSPPIWEIRLGGQFAHLFDSQTFVPFDPTQVLTPAICRRHPESPDCKSAPIEILPPPAPAKLGPSPHQPPQLDPTDVGYSRGRLAERMQLPEQVAEKLLPRVPESCPWRVRSPASSEVVQQLPKRYPHVVEQLLRGRDSAHGRCWPSVGPSWPHFAVSASTRRAVSDTPCARLGGPL